MGQARQSDFLHQMFTALSLRYDLINHLITLGLDGRWRRKAARECLAARPAKVLDLCCGSGALVISLARLAKNNTQLTGVDYSQPLLDIAAAKAKSLDGSSRISFVYGDAASLPFPDGCFDSIGIAFAFRNLTYENPLAPRYLSEVWRVLGKGGRFVILETSQPESKLVQKLYHLYLRCFVPSLGWLFSGNKSAYRYLARSAAQFYSAEEVKERMLTVGFREVSFRPLFRGVVGIHCAVK